jgi:hypothetical protein
MKYLRQSQILLMHLIGFIEIYRMEAFNDS